MNGGTGNWVTLLEFEKNVERSSHVSSGRWIGTQPMVASMPRSRSSPPLKTWLLKPLDVYSPRKSSRSLTFFWYSVSSKVARPLRSVASMPPSISDCRSGFTFGLPTTEGTTVPGSPRTFWVASDSGNFMPYSGWFPDWPQATRSLKSPNGPTPAGSR